ncbi:hypothetical protein DFJ73DRAFT_849311 [Zopfochytrium polystomum]|nr:hypothetical protein DFJ73DRAFT_849311 [Zopfochytrium polystomum]
MRGVLDRAALVEKLKATTPPLSIKPVLSCKWKASYAAAEKDKHRERILPEELMAYEWIFSDGWSYGYGNDAETQILVKFRKDGTRSNVNPLMPRPRPQPWEIQRDGSIRVANFPLHSRPKRTPDWGWTFTNGYVEYTAK